MPEISRFLGIKIYMYFNEHNPPHFHIQYNEYKALIDIQTFGVIEGKVPSKVLGLVVEWAEDNQKELLKNWNSMKITGEYIKIKPLVQMMISITKAKYLTEYKIYLEFSDGKNGNVDLEKYIFSTKLKFIQPLRDINIFQKFRLDYTLIWSDEIDLAPEFLYFKLFEDDKSLQEQFEKWGYV